MDSLCYNHIVFSFILRFLLSECIQSLETNFAVILDVFTMLGKFKLSKTSALMYFPNVIFKMLCVGVIDHMYW